MAAKKEDGMDRLRREGEKDHQIEKRKQRDAEREDEQYDRGTNKENKRP